MVSLWKSDLQMVGLSTSFNLFLYINIFVCLPEGIVLYQFIMSLHGNIQNLPSIFSSSARARCPVHLRIESVFCVTRNVFTAAGMWETNQKQAHDLFFVMTYIVNWDASKMFKAS